MADGLRVVTGETIAPRMRQLPAKTQRGMMRTALTKGGRVVSRIMKQAAPRESGALKRSVGVKIVTIKGSAVSCFVGPRRGQAMEVETRSGKSARKITKKTKVTGKRQTRNPARYAHLVEFGGRRAPPQPFMRESADSSSAESQAVIAASLRARLKKEFAKIK